VAGMRGEASASIEVAPGELGSSLCGVRLCVPEAQEQMQLSLSRLGQLTPVHAWRTSQSASLELFDGFKRCARRGRCRGRSCEPRSTRSTRRGRGAAQRGAALR
jgi:hypothetical protein